MSDCTHDCSSCGESCAERQGGSPFQIKPLREGCRVGKVYGVVSGKGGVGKSMVTSQLAVTMQRRGHNVAVLDADITGPSIPKAFGIHGRAAATEDAILPVITGTGIQLMSVNLLLKHETDPVIWRGPVIGGVVQQFWGDVLWQDVDYMFVDMPPGTGDVALNVFQTLPVDGVIIVASPQELVSMVVQKAVKMAQMMNIPIVGLVENMSYITCPDCGKKLYPFGEGKMNTVCPCWPGCPSTRSWPTWWTRAASRISRAIGWTPWPTSCKQISGGPAIGRASPLVYFSLSAAVFLVWFAGFHSFLALFSHL